MQVLARRFDTNGNALGDEFRVDQPTSLATDITQSPEVVVSPSGGFTVGWGAEISRVMTTTVPSTVSVDQDAWFDDNGNEHDVNLKDTLTSYTVQSMEPAAVCIYTRSYDASGNARGGPLTLCTATDTYTNSMQKWADLGSLRHGGRRGG